LLNFCSNQQKIVFFPTEIKFELIFLNENFSEILLIWDTLEPLLPKEKEINFLRKILILLSKVFILLDCRHNMRKKMIICKTFSLGLKMLFSTIKSSYFFLEDNARLKLH